MKKVIHWGMIGCGNVTEVKSGPAFYKARDSRLFGVTSRTLAKAYDYAKRHPVEKVFESAAQLIKDPRIDAVYIATPPSSHKEYALMCAAAGKVCYIEKPMAMNYQECLAIQTAFDQAGVKAFTAYYRRRMERFMKVKELVEEGAVGAVRFVNVTLYRPARKAEKAGSWVVNPEISGGGIFMDVAVHALDALDFIFGEIVTAKAVTANQGGYYAPEDNVCACFQFKSGITGTGVWCFTAYQQVDVIEIVGERGKISFGCHGAEPILWETAQGVTKIQAQVPQHVHQNLVQSIVDELNGSDVCPSTLESAMRTAKVCDMIYGVD